MEDDSILAKKAIVKRSLEAFIVTDISQSMRDIVLQLRDIGGFETKYMVREESSTEHLIGTVGRMRPGGTVSVRMTKDGCGFQVKAGAAGSEQVVGYCRTALRIRG